MINVNGDQDATSLWINARDYVESTYGRLKLLKQWAHDNVPRNLASYEELADLLDQTYKLAKMAKAYRQRPAFTQKIIAVFNQTWGGSRHRRHIVMSSAMREAVYSVSDNPSNKNVLQVYNSLIGKVGIPQQLNLDTAETVLVSVLHNNPANLVLDTGPWNSAIGMIATNIRKLLEQDPNTLWGQYQQNPNQFLQNQVKGFQQQLQQQVVNFWLEYAQANPPQDADDLQELLISMYDNAAFDLLSNQSLPNKDVLMPLLLQCHEGFEHARATKQINDLYQVCNTFIDLGLTYGTIAYSDVFK